MAALSLHGVTKNFGGLQALNDISFQAEENQITALIGPNGAGKTTLLNVINGYLKPNAGEINFYGDSIKGIDPFRVARKGIGRTFQIVKLFKELTVMENMTAAALYRARSTSAAAILGMPAAKREYQEVVEQAWKLLRFINLEHRAWHQAGILPYGQQRLVEISRALMGNPKMLLMDEPACGLNTQETRELEKIIIAIRDKGISVLLIEHEMKLVMGISNKVVVINYGQKIAEGNPEEIKKDEKVINAYLGRKAG
ncbi:MAG: ABC transporter ATP-binding protein [Firmicutes bacterium]|nr:ABC transporter ATP-binding protein [Bacillota bacterium]